MESNPQLELAFSYLENTGTNVFLTGKAGTGKTTFLKQLKSRSPKRMVVLAPTGVAAINAGGVTIHSFFQLSFGPYIAGVTRSDAASYVNKFSREKISIIRSIDLLVIDEISMVRADVLDAMDDVLRRYRDRHRPFGGVQLLMIGDIQQLAPVAKEEEWALLKKYYESVYFFHSKALQETSYVSIELKTIYRQQDTLFIDLLNRVRENHADDETLRLLNQRYIPAFTPADEEEYITLTTHNQQARKINDSRLASLTTPAHTFHAEVKDDFPDYAFPTDRQLVLKEGAQVMFVKNDSSPDKRYYNGKIGKVVAIGRDTIEVRGKEDGETIRVTREEWKNTRYTIDAGSKELIEKVEGTFKQYPLKTAWAITIHKSQGLTFDKAVIDPHAAFAHGQVYVALSRCRSLEGLVLSAPLHATALKKEETIDHFVSGITDPAQEELQRACKEYYKTLLLEQFNYDLLFLRVDYVYRVTSEHLYLLYPGFVQRYREARDHLLLELGTVSKRFQNQLARLIDASNDPATDPALAERVAKGQLYFEEQTERFAVSLLEEGMPDIDNKETRKIIERAIAPLIEECNVKTETLKALQGGFSIKKYLIAKAKARIPVPIPKPSGEKKSAAGRKEKKGEDTLDIQHPALYQALRAWRRAESEKTNLPAYSILQQRALVGIANLLPTSKSDLLAIPGIGKVIAERYGRQILELVDTHRMRSDHEE